MTLCLSSGCTRLGQSRFQGRCCYQCLHSEADEWGYRLKHGPHCSGEPGIDNIPPPGPTTRILESRTNRKLEEMSQKIDAIEERLKCSVCLLVIGFSCALLFSFTFLVVRDAK